MTKSGIEEQPMRQSTIEVLTGATKGRAIQATTAVPNSATAKPGSLTSDATVAHVGFVEHCR